MEVVMFHYTLEFKDFTLLLKKPVKNAHTYGSLIFRNKNNSTIS